jgi:hypothetical protein
MDITKEELQLANMVVMANALRCVCRIHYSSAPARWSIKQLTYLGSTCSWQSPACLTGLSSTLKTRVAW